MESEPTWALWLPEVSFPWAWRTVVSARSKRKHPCHWKDVRAGTGEGSVRALPFGVTHGERADTLLLYYPPIQRRLAVSCLYVPFPQLILQEPDLF